MRATYTWIGAGVTALVMLVGLAVALRLVG
jgi:hypothetical protein